MEKYLERCIDSVIGQTYRNIEIILINDGSQDNSERICTQYEKRYPFIHYERQINAGVSAARNKGIESASGEWICFIDPDDYLDPDFLENLYDGTTKDCDVICCGCIVELNSKSVKNSFFGGNRIFKRDKRELYMQLLDSNYHAETYRYTGIGVPWAKLYRTEFIRKYNLFFDISLKRMQDNIFNFRVFSQADKIYYVDFTGYHYVVEHVEMYPYTYDGEAKTYLAKVLQMQMEIMRELELFENEEAFQMLAKEAVRLYILAVQKSFYSCPDMSYFEKCRHASKLLHENPFFILFEKAKNVKNVRLIKLGVHLNMISIIITIKNIWKRIHWIYRWK